MYLSYAISISGYLSNNSSALSRCYLVHLLLCLNNKYLLLAINCLGVSLFLRTSGLYFRPVSFASCISAFSWSITSHRWFRLMSSMASPMSFWPWKRSLTCTAPGKQSLAMSFMEGEKSRVISFTPARYPYEIFCRMETPFQQLSPLSLPPDCRTCYRLPCRLLWCRPHHDKDKFHRYWDGRRYSF